MQKKSHVIFENCSEDVASFVKGDKLVRGLFCEKTLG